MPSKKQSKGESEIDETEVEETETEETEVEDPPKRGKPTALFPPQKAKPKSENSGEPFNALGEVMKPVVDVLNQVNERLAKAFPDPTEPPPKQDPPKPEPRKYRLFDEFDPSLEG